MEKILNPQLPHVLWGWFCPKFEAHAILLLWLEMLSEHLHCWDINPAKSLNWHGFGKNLKNAGSLQTHHWKVRELWLGKIWVCPFKMVKFPGSFVSLLNPTRLQSGPSHELSKVFGACKLFVQCLFVKREDCCGECRCSTHTPCCPNMLMFIGFPTLCKINVVIISEVESYETMEIVDVAARPFQGVKVAILVMMN